MGTLRRVFRWLALAGFTLSLIVHVLASAGMPPSWRDIPVLLAIPMFVLWIPVPFALDAVRRRHPGRSQVSVILASVTLAERLFSLVVVGYFVLNLVLFDKGAYGPQEDETATLRLLSGSCLAMYWSLALLLREPA